MTSETDVLVIGGGGTGVGIARDLAMRGLEVTLCERGGLGSGTSGRSHGLLHSGARYAEADREGATECIEENRILKGIAGACIRDTGGYFVQLADDDPAYFESKLAACRDLSIPAEVYDGRTVRETTDALAADVKRVMRVPDGVIRPSRLVAATAESAREHGGAIHTHTAVSDIHTNGERVTGVTTEGGLNGRIDADYVVNAAGAWAGQVGADLGLGIDMQPTRGVMVAVDFEGVDTVLNRARDPDDGDIVVPHERQVVLGTTSVPVDDPDEYEQADWEIERTIEECARMVPGIEGLDPSRVYWGVRPLFGPDEGERDGRGISRGFFLLDHAARDGIEGICSVVGGKLTTHRLMAEAIADHVASRMGVEAPCRTAEERLPGVDDPAVLDRLVANYDARGPADEDVLAV
jgi:glycerol-3-phosphate dehydrogenase